MNTRAFLFVGALFLSALLNPVHAQRGANKGPFTIQWGDAAALPKGHRPLEYFAGDNAYFQLTQSKKLLGLVNYDKKLNNDGNSVMEKPRSKYMVFENLEVWNNTPLLFFSDYDKKAKSEKLLLLKIDPKGGDISGSPEEILTSKGKIERIGSKKFNIVVPQQGDNLLVYYMSIREKRDDSKNKDKYTFAVFDKGMNLKWEKEVKMPFVEANMRIIGHRVFNDRVFTFCYTRSKPKGDEFDDLSVLEINEESDKVIVHKVETPKGVLSDVILSKYSEGNSIVFTGLLKKNKSASAFHGYFVGVFDPENPSATEFRTFEFSDELIRANESERAKRKMDKSVKKGKDPGMPYVQMRNIHRRSDGGYYIVMEQYFLYVQRIKAGNVTIYIYHYYYMDVLVASISETGEEEWIRKLSKHQYFVNYNYLGGINSFMVGDNLMIFYADHFKNKGNDENAVPTTFSVTRDGLLMCAKLTPEGELTRNVITDLKDEQKVVSPKWISEISEGRYFGSGKEYKNKGEKKALSSRPFIIEIKDN